MYRIEEIMLEKKITMYDLSKRLNVGPMQVKSIVTGKQDLTVTMLLQVAKALEVPETRLLEGSELLSEIANSQITCPHCGQQLNIRVSAI